jgi:3-deoxy-7-phosphoheptulonate synthase
MDLVYPATIVDANHSNSNKDFRQQLRIVREVMMSRRFSADVKNLVKGVMVESYLEEGSQKISDHQVYGQSITDPCLGWEDSKKLLYMLADLNQ